MTPTLKKVIVALVTLLLLGGAYYEFFTGTPTTPVSLDSTGDLTVGQDILVLVQKLSTVRIDPSLFSSPLLSGLRDTSAPINPEIQGRTNPFAPIGQN